MVQRCGVQARSLREYGGDEGGTEAGAEAEVEVEVEARGPHGKVVEDERPGVVDFAPILARQPVPTRNVFSLAKQVLR